MFDMIGRGMEYLPGVGLESCGGGVVVKTENQFDFIIDSPFLRQLLQHNFQAQPLADTPRHDQSHQT